MKHISTNIQAQDLLDQLELAVITHEDWLGTLNRALICQKPDLVQQFCSINSHKTCQFGIWFESIFFKNKHDNQIIYDIDLIHQRMHATAQWLMEKLQRKESISPEAYDELLFKRLAFRGHVSILINQIYDMLLQTDPLTRVLNRQKMVQTLEREKDSAQTKPIIPAITLADIDFFKHVNDTYGHAVGDRVLKMVAQIFMSHMRPMDLIFRYGGEEFLLYMQSMDIHTAAKTIDRLRQKLLQHPFQLDNGEQLTITASFGLSVLDSDRSIQESIEEADKALYLAKERGRNRVEGLYHEQQISPC
ncbi:MAG: diguanylate cyclase [Magnetococcus sp. DMHC-6]